MPSRIATGRLVVAAYYLQCPHCSEYIDNRGNYSSMWGVDSAAWETGGEKEIDCSACGATVRLPKKLLP